MKKIVASFSLLTLLFLASCDTSKKGGNVTTTSEPPIPVAEPEKPKKGEMKESDLKALPTQQYEKKTLPQKGKLKPMEAVIEADSVVPKRG